METLFSPTDATESASRGSSGPNQPRPQGQSAEETWRQYREWGQQHRGEKDPQGDTAGIKTSMPVKEALELFGLEDNFGKEQLQEVYRRLALENHPDRGGSTATMQKINQAKEVLIGELLEQRLNKQA